MNAKMKAILNVVIVAVVSVALLFGMSAITDTLVKRQEDEAAKIAFGDILNADRLEAIATKDTEGITSAYKALDKNGALIGYAVTATVKGYGGDMAVHVALTPDGSEFIGLRVGSHMETEGYGSKAAEAAYTDRFAGLKAPVSLNGYTGIEGLDGNAGTSSSPASSPASSSPSSQPAAMKDGTYKAEETTYTQGYKYFLELTVKGGKITAVNWDAYKENSSTTKKQESKNGSYVMTETGKKWHEQAKIMEDALIASNSPDAIRYQESDGKTDAYAGVSVDISAFVKLAKNAVEQARGNASPAPTGMFKDGHYKAEQADYHQGYKYYVEITIKNGKISAVDWDAYKENSHLTKKKESEDGTYVMTETGKKWHEQAKIMQDALMAAGDPAKIKYNPEDGKTDAYAGVSVDVSAFVQLANQALDEAKVTKTGTSPRGAAAEIDGVSGATISSKAVVKAANLAYVFVQAVK